MDWYLILLIFLGLLIFLILMGLPVAFAFLATNFICLYFFADGTQSLYTVIPSGFSMMTSITMLAVPLFILMGEVIFHSGVGWAVLEALDLWIGRLPGRLSLLAVIGGTIFAMLSGSSIATIAMLGSVLIPVMRRKDYSRTMCVGPILAGGGLALIIPPTFLGVVLAGLADISVADLLVALVVPGLLLAFIFIAYIFISAKFCPQLAPPYPSEDVTFGDRLRSLKHILPLGIIVFLVMGVIFLGVATPTEAAALGALGSFGLAFAYRKMTLEIFKKIILETASITCVIFMIIIGSVAFSQLLAYTGASKEMVTKAMELPLEPMLVFIILQVTIFILGFFMDQASIMMIAIPLLAPVVSAMGYDLVWFGTVTLLNLSIAGITPPFGLNLFAMKGVAPDDIGMDVVIRSAVPYVLLGLVGLALVIAFPGLALWLPAAIK